MPNEYLTASEEKKGLDALAALPQEQWKNPQAVEYMNRIGVSPEEVQGWKAANALPDHPESILFKNNLYLKLSDKKPAQAGQGVSWAERQIAKNFLDNDPNLVIPFLQKQGYDVRIVPGKERKQEFGGRGQMVPPTAVNVKSPDEIQVRDKTTNRWAGIEGQNYSVWEVLQDIQDITFDVVESLSTGGAAVAGGLSAGPAGAIAAGGVSSAAFESLKQGISQALGFQDNLEPEKIAFKGLTGGISSAIPVGASSGLRMVGEVAELAPKKGIRIPGTSKYFQEPSKLRANVQQIDESAEILGTKATPAQRYANESIMRRQEDIAKSNSFIGRNLNAEITEAIEKTDLAADFVLKNREKFDVTRDVGADIINQMKDAVEEKLAPAAAKYKQFYDNFGDKPFKKKPILDEIAKLREENPVSKARSYLDELEGDLADVKTLQQLKNWRTSIGQNVDVNSPFQRKVAERMYAVTTKARNDSVNVPEARKMLQEADSIYAKVNGDLEQILNTKNTGSRTGKKLVDQFIDDLNKETSKVVQKILRNQDPKAMAKFAKEYPAEFNLARNQRINEIFENSFRTERGNIRKLSPKAVAAYVDKLKPETRNLLFDGDELLKARALRVFLDNMPSSYNPSGTGDRLLRQAFTEINALKTAAIQDIMTSQGARQNFFKRLADAIDSSTATQAVSRLGVEAIMPREPDIVRGKGLQAPVDIIINDQRAGRIQPDGLRLPGGQ